MFLPVLFSSFLFSLLFCHANEITHQPFGSGKFQPVKTIEGFPSPIDFYQNYLQRFQPVLMRGAALAFPAFKNWDDHYFESLDLTHVEDYEVTVETIKKEHRQQAVKRMHFHDFLAQYNQSQIYMVQPIPSFLKHDVAIPWPMQCSLWNTSIADVIVWFSSGGTSSVIHTDSANNINCLIRGRKKVIFVDPDKFGSRIELLENGRYSPMDVDDIDFDVYPQMQGVEYYQAEMNPGDCIFIPFEWIHQVRSFDRNIAVNFWFGVQFQNDADEANDLSELLSDCSPVFNVNATLDLVNTFTIPGSNLIFQIRVSAEKHDGKLNREQFFKTFVNFPDELSQNFGIGWKEPLTEVFSAFDLDRDDLISLDDLNSIPVQTVEKALGYMNHFEMLMNYISDAEEAKEKRRAKDEF